MRTEAAGIGGPEVVDVKGAVEVTTMDEAGIARTGAGLLPPCRTVPGDSGPRGRRVAPGPCSASGRVAARSETRT
jgi:hypothetical protein